ncbi:MAG: tyrosine recombinase XerC [Clostridiaceae bacterium]|nr:tyrosine recombinase XerC [Clostridiaceae bacterium]
MKKSFYWLDEFISYFSGIRERADGTIQEYQYDLELFFRFLKQYRGLADDIDFDEIPIEDIDLDFIKSIQLSEMYRFISWLGQARENGPAARSRRISALRSFFNFLHTKAKVIDSNPAAELESPKQKRTLPKHLSIEESLSVLSEAANSDDPFAARDYCILTLFLNCGMRLSELCNINLADIKGETLTVMGKGGKERTIYLNSISLQAINEYLPHRIKPKLSEKDSEDALFISRNRRRISQRAVQNVVKKYLAKAGLDTRKYSVHKLRHTAATLMYQHGQVDIRSLQQILGHSSVSTTEIYTHVHDDMLHEAVENNPLNTYRKSDFIDDSSDQQ